MVALAATGDDLFADGSALGVLKAGVDLEVGFGGFLERRADGSKTKTWTSTYG